MFLQNLALRVTAVVFSLVFVLGEWDRCYSSTTADSASASPTSGDPNDWVNVDYVISQAKGQSHSDTVDAKATIVRNAGSSAGKGPWSKHVLHIAAYPMNSNHAVAITNSKGDLPPSGDPHDYLSWAP